MTHDTSIDGKTLARGAALIALLAARLVHANSAEGMRSYRSLAISGGERIAAVEAVEGEAKTGPRIVVRDTATGKIVSTSNRPIARLPHRGAGLVAGPEALALISTDPKAGTATVVLLRDGGLTPVATVKGVADTVRWSPDGRQLAFLATVGARKLTGAVEAGARQVGEIGVAEQEDEQRIAIVVSGAAAATIAGVPERHLHLRVRLDPGRQGLRRHQRQGQRRQQLVDRDPRPRRCGQRQAARAGGAEDADEHAARVAGRPHGRLHRRPDERFRLGRRRRLHGAAGRRRTGRRDAGLQAGTFNGIAWRGKAGAGVECWPARRRPWPRSTPRPAAQPRAVEGAGRRRPRRATAASCSARTARWRPRCTEDFEHAPRIVAGRLPELAPITRDNESFAPQVAARSVSWTNEGYKVQGWLVGPRTVDAGKTYPMIVQVHGGPAAAATPRYISGGEGGNSLVRDLVKEGLFRVHAQPARQLRPGRGLHQRQPARFRRRRLARHPGRRRRRHHRQAPVDGNRLGPDGPFLRRLHDDVGRDAQPALQGGRGRRRHRQLDQLLRPERHRPVDGAVLRRHHVRRSGDLPRAIADRIDQGGARRRP
jgi:hypothetical protein